MGRPSATKMDNVAIRLDGGAGGAIPNLTVTADGNAVIKQATTPGTAQTGNANLTGTVVVGKVVLPTGAAGTAGTATLVAGTVTISTTAVTANSVVLAVVRTPAGAPQGAKLAVPTITGGTSFIVNAVDTATGATVATDTSTIYWSFVN